MGNFFKSIIVGVQMAFIEMGAHKMRSALSMIGVFLGVASLMAMLTLIGGIDVYLNQKMGKWIGSIWFWKKGNPASDEKLSWSRTPGMHYSDGNYLEGNSPDVKSVVKEISRRQSVALAGVTQRANIRGVAPQTLERDLEHFEIKRGAWPSAQDYRDANRVCVVSQELDERVRDRKTAGRDSMSVRDIIGQDMVVQGVPFTIIGVYGPIDPDFSPWQMRRCIVIPIEAMRTYVTGVDPDPGSFEVAVSDVKKTKEEALRITQVMASRHRGVQDFEYRSAEWLDQMTKMLNNISLLMTIVSVISLLVGGLSIMNVMLSSISERIHEIGVRKALGARNLQLFIQFIAETTTLSFVGGLSGIFLGMVPIAFKEAIQKSTDGVLEPTIMVAHVVYVVTIIAGVGIIFGLYPALRAMRLNPVEALRYE
jgi:putative ABC transport system permease protein